MLYELRVYDCCPGRLPALLNRFQNTTLKIWERHGIPVQFAVHKQNLDQVRVLFEAETYQHIGDTNIDEHYAVMHGFQYLDVAHPLDEPWMTTP